MTARPQKERQVQRRTATNRQNKDPYSVGTQSKGAKPNARAGSDNGTAASHLQTDPRVLPLAPSRLGGEHSEGQS